MESLPAAKAARRPSGAPAQARTLRSAAASEIRLERVHLKWTRSRVTTAAPTCAPLSVERGPHLLRHVGHTERLAHELVLTGHLAGSDAGDLDIAG